MQISLGRPLPIGIGRVSQWFGSNPAMYKRFNLAGHNGIDYACAIGSQVLAAHAGKLELRPYDANGYGFNAIIHGKDYDTRYAHLSRFISDDGAELSQGQQFAVSGNTGNSTGPHLHFALKVHGMKNQAYSDYIDPAPFRDI